MAKVNQGLETTLIPWIDEQSLASEHERLYHYTSFINLRSILESKGLRATPYSATNDRDEFFAAADILCPKIYEHAKIKLSQEHPSFFEWAISEGLDPDEELQKDSRTFYEAGLRTNAYRPHLACFSYHSEHHHKQNGILTMWRTYGGDDGGIALGFDTKQVVDKSSKLQSDFGYSAIYLDYASYGANDARLSDRLQDASDLFAAYFVFLDAQIRGKPPTLGIAVLHKLLVLTACVKHADFSDEREIRMIVGAPDESKKYPKPVTMHGVRMLLEIADCLKEIIIGPSKDQKAIAAAVNHTLAEFGKSDVEVRFSQTPYRSY